MPRRITGAFKTRIIGALIICVVVAIDVCLCGCGRTGELKVAWKVPGVYTSAIKVVNNTLIVSEDADGGGRFSAFELTSGRLIWSEYYHGVDATRYPSFKTHDNEVFAPMVCSNDQRRCLIADIDARTGKKLKEFEIWTLDSLGDPRSPEDRVKNFGIRWITNFDVNDKYIVVTAWNGKVKTVDRLSGAAMWEIAAPNENLFTVTSNDLFYVDGTKVVALRLESGQKVWERRLDTSGAPFYAQDLVMTTAGDSEDLYAMDAKSGKEVWVNKNKKDGWEGVNQAAAYDGRLVLANYGSPLLGLICLDLATGKQLWSFNTHSPYKELDGFQLSVPLIVGGIVCFGCNTDGYLYALDLETGRLLKKHYLGRGSSVLSTDGKCVYVGDPNGDVYKFQKIRKSR